MNNYNTISIETITPEGLESSVITLNFLDFFVLISVPLVFLFVYRLIFRRRK